jgi:hypothetical protein
VLGFVHFGGLGGHHRAPVAFLHLMRILVVGCEIGRRRLRCLALAIAPSIIRTRSCLVSIVSAAITGSACLPSVPASAHWTKAGGGRQAALRFLCVIVIPPP